MDENEEIDFPFDLSEWTVVDEDVCEDNAHGPLNSNKTPSKGNDKSVTSGAIVKSKTNSTTHSNNQATGNKTGLTPMNAAKSTVSSSSITVKNVEKSAGCAGTSDSTKIVTKLNAPSNISDSVKNVVKSNAPSNVSDSVKNVVKSNAPSNVSDSVKNVVKFNAPSNVSDSVKNVAKPASGVPNVVAKNIATSLTPSKTTKTVANTSQANKPGESASVSEISRLFNLSGNNSQIKSPVTSKSSSGQTPQINVAGVTTVPSNTSSKGSANVKSTPSSGPSSIPASNSLKGVAVPNIASKPASTLSAAPPKTSTSAVKNTGQLVQQTTTSKEPMKITTQIKDKTNQVGSIAEIMESVDKKSKTTRKVNQNDMEDVSDTEFTETMDIAKCLVSKVEIKIGVKREASPNKEGPSVKKTKIQSSAASDLVRQGNKQNQSNANEPTGIAVSQEKLIQRGTTEVNAANSGPKKQQQCGKVDENTVNKSTKKGSFGAVKTVTMKIKDQPIATQSPAKTPTSLNKIHEPESKTEISNISTASNMPAKRIIHRFHRMIQTVPIERSNKLLQCLIRIPSADAPPKSNFAIQAISEKTRDDVFYQKTLPDTVRPEVFKVVSAFGLNLSGSRNIITVFHGLNRINNREVQGMSPAERWLCSLSEDNSKPLMYNAWKIPESKNAGITAVSWSFDYGISLGHVTTADMEKSLFRENILSKSAHYSLYFDRQDFGVLDLLFAEEEQFLTVVTHIRKMKIGPRNLVVTYCKNLKEKDCAPGFQPSCVKATIIYNQNFASTCFLTHIKAPLWNKPKVEETMTIHNLPGGIPLDFLKLIIPDAITIQLDDKKQKFTQEGSRVRLGMNRKNGGDRFLKLFSQVYINNECLAISVAGTPVGDVPELTEILKEREKRQKEKKLPVREIKAVPRDINAQTVATVKDSEVDMVMYVETVDNVDKVLTGQMSAWKGPNSIEKLKRAFSTKGQTKTSSTLKTVTSSKAISTQNTNPKSKSKDKVLSDVSDFSDISDTSNVGEESTLQKKNEKKNVFSATQRKSISAANKFSRSSSKSASIRSARKLHADAARSTQRKSVSTVLNNSRQRTEKPERFKDEGHSNLASKQSLSRDNSDTREVRHLKVEDRSRGKFDRTRNISDTNRENDSYRKNTTEDRGRDESVSFRERLSKRDAFERFDSGLFNEDRGRHEFSDIRPVRERQRSEGRDDRITQLNLEVDRHGNRIVSCFEKKDPERKMENYVQDRLTDRTRHDKVVRDNMFDERGGRGDERLEHLIHKRLTSLERQGWQSRDTQDNRLANSRSSNMRRVQGRSASPRRRRSNSPTSFRTRRLSPLTAGENQNRFGHTQRSRSPLQQARYSSMFPINMEDENKTNLDSVWFSEPAPTFEQDERNRSLVRSDSGLTRREDVRKTSSRPTTNFASSLDNWASKGSQESEREPFDTSNHRRLLGHLVEHVTATRKNSSGSKTSSGKRSPSQFIPDVHDASKFFEKNMYGSRVNFTNTRGEPPGELSNTVSMVSVKAQSGNRSAGDYGNRVSSMLRPLLKMSMNPTHSKGYGEPVNRFESRFDYEENMDDEDIQQFDASAGSKNRMFCRESDIESSQSGSRAYREFDMMGNRQKQKPLPIPPPVSPPLFKSPPTPSQERISHLESMAKILAADLERQPPKNTSQDMRNAPTQRGFQMPGPPPPPPMSFSGPNSSQGENNNFSGPDSFQGQDNNFSSQNSFQGQDNNFSSQNSFQGQDNNFPGPYFFQGQDNNFPASSFFQGQDNNFSGSNFFQGQDSNFSGPNSFQEQNSNFPCPPIPFRPPNTYPQHDMYLHPPPWPQDSYF